jgi:alpha 1,3-glucosidase
VRDLRCTHCLQAAAYQPFFRSHAHLDSPRREPYLYAEPYRRAMRNAMRERYALLPYWYTLNQVRVYAVTCCAWVLV